MSQRVCVAYFVGRGDRVVIRHEGNRDRPKRYTECARTETVIRKPVMRHDRNRPVGPKHLLQEPQMP
jgi:hypothetical protein